MKCWLVLYNRIDKRKFTKYFETEDQKDKYKISKLKYSKNLILIEDSTDIYFID